MHGLSLCKGTSSTVGTAQAPQRRWPALLTACRPRAPQHLDEILDEEGNVMLIARDVDGRTTANINGRSFDVQIDRQARCRARPVAGAGPWEALHLLSPGRPVLLQAVMSS